MGRKLLLFTNKNLEVSIILKLTLWHDGELHGGLLRFISIYIRF